MNAPLAPQAYAGFLRQDLSRFIHRSFIELNPETAYLHNGHIDVMAQALTDVLEGRTRRLIINLPPRSLKSHSASVAFVAWVLGRKPSWQIICASYGQELADKLARDTRNLMLSGFYKQIFATRLADRIAVNDFATTAGGGRMATSVGGVLTGRGADLIIIDDPLKAEDGLSETKRNEANGWMDHTLLSRLNNKQTGAIVVVAQRLHQDDLCGHLIEQGGWAVLRFAAIAEEDEEHIIGGLFGKAPFRRKAGEALHPAREGLQTLLGIKAQIGDYNFQGQYQQEPVPRDGTVIKREWFRFYAPEELPAHFDEVLLSWDTASKIGQRNDYSACTVWGVCRRRFYLLDVRRARLTFPDLQRLAIEMAEDYSGANILIEDRSSGQQLIQALQEHRILGVIGYSPPSDQDKLVRVHAQAPLFQDGSVLFPKAAAWLDDYMTELLAFPGGRHDDQVDSTAQALAHLRQSVQEDYSNMDLDQSALRRANPWAI